MDITYFTFHRELKSTHEEAMDRQWRRFKAPRAGLSELSPEESDAFGLECSPCLDYLEGFWKGLDQPSAYL